MPRHSETRGPLPRSFYDRSPLVVARELIGKLLVRFVDGKRWSGMIVEAEAYNGETDTACHASRGRTQRTAVMYGPPGHAYIYFTYGMHWMLNAVTEPEGIPAAVLVRALEPVEGIDAIRLNRRNRPDRELTSGPARLCSALGIDRRINGTDLVQGKDLVIETYRNYPDRSISRGRRIGIDYAAKKDRQAPWRFWLGGNPFVSRGKPGTSRRRPRKI